VNLEEAGYVQCDSCHGAVHEDDVVDGLCWLCQRDEALD
jgi:hypothetical protein